MRTKLGLALAALVAVASSLSPGGPAAAAPEKALVTVANASPRIAYCAVVVDGRTRTMLQIRPGKAWADEFDPRRTVQLVCERAAKSDGVWRVKAGAAYRLVDLDGKVDLAEGAE